MINNILLLVLCTIASIQDIKTRKVKNKFNFTCAILGFLFVLFIKEVTIVDAIFGFVCAFFLGIVCWRIGAFKAGDAKFMWTIGILKGIKHFWFTMIASILASGVLALIIILKNKDGKQRMTRLWLYGKGLLLSRKYSVYEPENPEELPFTIPLWIGCLIDFIFL